MSEESRFRRIRSFVRREGRLTTSQKAALDSLWPSFGLDLGTDALDFDKIFGRSVPRILEIGYGMGASLTTMAAASPGNDYIGIEVHRPGVGALLKSVQQQGLSNVRTFNADAIEVLENCIPVNSLDGLYLFFPDPWHKKRHHKRRIVQHAFLATLAGKLKTGGVLHMATDWEDYARQMMEVGSASSAFINQVGEGQFSPRPDYRPLTKFEQRGRRLGHGVWDLLFKRL